MGGGNDKETNNIVESAESALVDWEANVILSLQYQELEIILITVEDEEGQEEEQRRD